MRHASLFTGIGGFDLAAQWMGWENVFQVEIDSFCQKVLEKNFPNVKRYGDIKEFDGTKYRGAIDVLSGGFPCQPYSTAGQRKGKEDPRHLWPEMLRVIREVQPKWIVGENVRGLISWSGGLVFEEVQSDLETAGYEVQSFLLPACGKNAPHRRERIWIVAHSGGDGWQRGKRTKERQQHPERGSALSESNTHVLFRPPADTLRFRFEGGGKTGNENEKENEIETRSETIGTSCYSWEDFPTQPPIYTGNDGIPEELVECAIAATGNAIVPQIAFEIFKAIDNTITPTQK